MFLNPLILGGRVRKDCVVGRKETPQISRTNGVGIGPSRVHPVVRDLDSAQQPLSYVIIEYLGVLGWIWVRRIMRMCFLSIRLGSHQACKLKSGSCNKEQGRYDTILT